MKLKLISGNSSFSFEGELQEAIAVLEKYWNPLAPAPEDQRAPAEEAGKSPPKKAKPKRAKKAPVGAAATSVAGVSIDAQALSNKIKTDEHFAAVKAKVLDRKGDWVSKCKMVAYFAGEPITSGDVRRTMDAFKVKNSLPTLSKALSGNSDQFLTTGDNPVKYELTSIAESDFLNWLTKTENE